MIVMRNLFLLPVLLCQMASGEGSFTNYLSFHLIAESIPSDVLSDGNIKPEGLKLVPTPVLSDTDFKYFDCSNHTFVVTAESAKRLASILWRLDGFDEPMRIGSGEFAYQLCGPDTPFVLIASGDPVYVGIFSTSTSSFGSSLPTVWPADHAFLPINATNDVKFIIRLRQPSPRLLAVPDNTNAWVDMREDKRILAALEKLSIQTKPPAVTNASGQP